jgi:hypothetical protein
MTKVQLLYIIMAVDVAMLIILILIPFKRKPRSQEHERIRH